MSSIKYTEYQQGPVSTHSIIWNIPDFMNNRNVEILSDKCFLTENENSRKPRNFELKVRFYGHNNHLIEFYFLSRTTAHLSSRFLVFRRFIDNNSRRELHECAVKIETKDQTAYANTWKFLTRFYKKNSDSNESISNAISHDGGLDLYFNFVIDNCVNAVGLPIGPIYEGDNQFTKIYEDLFISGLYSDIVMKSADNVEFKVHKAVLASRSAVLMAHFEHNTIECQTNIIGSPLDSDVLNEVLTFIYSDKAPRVDEMPEKLLAAGDYYQLDKLKNLASRTLYEKLSVDNAVETLQLADVHSVPNLKKWTLIYITNAFSSVQRTDGWAKLNSAELLKTLCEYIANTGVHTQ